MTRRPSIAALALLVGFAPVALAQEPEKKPPQSPKHVEGAEVISLEGEALGSTERSFAELLGAIARDPDAPGSILAAEALYHDFDLVPDGRTRAFAALKTAAAAAKDGFAAERYLALFQGLLWSAGDREGARKLSQERGYLRRWVTVGPFGRGRRAILHEGFPPEVDARAKAFDPKVRYTTTKGEASWAKVPGAEQISHDVRPAQVLRAYAGAIYCVTHFEVGADQDAVLVYRGPSAKVFCDRALAALVDRHQNRLEHELRFPVKLHKGWNRVVVKTADGGSSFSLRLATVEGRAFAFREEAELAGHDVPANPEVEPPAPRPGVVLEKLAGAKEPALVALRGHALLGVGLGEEGNAELDLVQKDLEGQAWFFVLRAQSYSMADHLPGAERRVRSRSALEAALKLDPLHAVARRLLADQILSDAKTKEGILEIEKVLDEHPGALAVRFQLLRVLQSKGWERDAERTLAEIEKKAPDAAMTINARAQWLHRKGDIKGALDLEKRIWEADKAAFWARSSELALAEANGDWKAAKALIDEQAALDPDRDADYAHRYASLARAQGDLDGEIAALEVGSKARPLDLNLRESIARTLAERGKPGDAERAISLLESILSEEPARHGARRLKLALQGKREEFWKEWDVDPIAIVKGAPGPDAYPKAATICLHDQTVTRIYPDGSSVEVIHQLFKILNEEGVEGEDVKSRRAAGELMEVRTFSPNGEISEPIRAGTGAFEMPALAPGACIEHKYKLEHGASDFQYQNGPWYFQDPGLVQPYLRSRWIVIAPRDMSVETIEKNMEAHGATKTEEIRGDLVVRTWETRNQDRIEPEPHMPPRDEFLPHVRLYERRSLEEIAGFYRDEGLGRTFVTPSVRAKAEEVAGKIEGDLARAKAVFAFVKEHCTKPGGGATASQILAAKGGSKLVLFEAMLRALGVPFRHALAAQAPDTDLEQDWDHPVPGQFHTPLVRVEPRDGAPVWLFVEGPRYAPFGMLPSFLWGAPVYVIDRDGGSLEVVPRGACEDQCERTFNLRVALDASGGAKVGIDILFPRYEAYNAKESVKNAAPQQIQNFADGMTNQLFTGAKVLGKADIPGLTDPSVPLRVRLQAEAPKLVRRRGDGSQVLFSGLDPLKLKAALGGRARRKFDLILDSWVVRRDRVTIDLGPWVAPRLPQNVMLEAPFGQYSLSFVREGGMLRIERALTLRPRRVKPGEDYTRFLSFLEQVDAAEQRPIIVEPRE